MSLCFSLSFVRIATPAALLQCVIDTYPEPTAATSAAADSGIEWSNLSAVSMACVGRHCGAIMKACVGLAWEAKVDVAHWLKELENLKVSTGERCRWRASGRSTVLETVCVGSSTLLFLKSSYIRTSRESDNGAEDNQRRLWKSLGGIFVDASLSLSPSLSPLISLLHPGLSSTDQISCRQILVRVDKGANPDVDVGTRRSLPLALEGLDKDKPPPSAVVVFYRLLDPDAAVEQLKSKWSELVEPPAPAAAAACSDSDSGSDSGGGSSSGVGTPWARKLDAGVGG